MTRKPSRVPSPQRRAELRAEILAVIARIGTSVSLRRLEEEIKAHRSTIALVVAELHAEGLLVKCPGHPRAPKAPTWGIRSGDASGDSGDHDRQVPVAVPTVDIVIDDPVTTFETELRAKGVDEDTIAHYAAKLAESLVEVTARAERQTAMLAAILESLAIPLDSADAEQVFASVRDLPHGMTDAQYLAVASAALVAVGRNRFATTSAESEAN